MTRILTKDNEYNGTFILTITDHEMILSVHYPLQREHYILGEDEINKSMVDGLVRHHKAVGYEEII